MQPLRHIQNFFRLPVDVSIDPQVRTHFRRNFINNTFDVTLYVFGESFVSVNTILPVFASTITDSAILIGLVPALIHAGWFIPQLLLAGYVQRLPKKLPFAKRMALVERMPYFVLPLTAFLLPWISREAALWLFMLVVTMRGLAGGAVALPWQEIIATVIPSSARSRFIGFSHTLGRIFAVIGSAISGIILANLSYPNNYALSFLIGAIIIFLSYTFFARTIEPVKEKSITQNDPQPQKSPLINFSSFKKILQEDKNFRKYINSRIFFQLGSMGTAFFAVYGIQRFSLPDEQAALFSGLLFASSIIGFSFWGFLGDRVGPRMVLLVSDILQIIVLVMALVSPTIWLYNLVFLFFGLAQSGSIVGELIMCMELGTEEERPNYLGLARSLPGVFILVAPLIGGSVVTWFGYQSMFLFAVFFAVIGVGYLISVRERKHDQPVIS